jgi:hypothetical protein
MKIAVVVLVAYAIVGGFHSYREYRRRPQVAPELLALLPADYRHRWFMCGLTWLPTSIVFPLMPPPFGGSRTVWFMENIKDSFVSWCLFAAIIAIGVRLWN